MENTRTNSQDKKRSSFWSSAYYNKKPEAGRGRQNWRQRKEARPDRAFYTQKGKPWRKDREEEWRRPNTENDQPAELEARECQRYTYHKGQLVQVSKVKDDLDEQKGVETNNSEDLDRVDETRVDRQVPIIRPYCQEIPKAIPNRQEVPEVELMDQEVPNVIGTGDLEKASKDDHREVKKDLGCQEVPVNASEVTEEVLDKIEAMKVSDCLNESKKKMDCLEISEEATKASKEEPASLQNQEKTRNIAEDIIRSETQEERAGCETLLEMGPQDLVKLEHCLDYALPADSPKNIWEKEEGKKQNEHQKVWRKVEDTQGNVKRTTTIIAEKSCSAYLERTEKSRSWTEEASNFAERPAERETIELEDKSNCSPLKQKVNRNGEDVIMDSKLERWSDDGNIEMPSSEVDTNICKASSSDMEGTCHELKAEGGAQNMLPLETATFKQTKISTKSEEVHRTAANSAVEEAHISSPEDKPTNIESSLPDSCMESGMTDKHLTTGKEEHVFARCSNTSRIEETVEEDDPQKTLEQILAEISTHLSEKDVHIQPLLGNFSEFAETPVEQGRFGHIIEVYGFSSKFGTEDLMEPFLEYRDRGFRLHWVDQTHALAIFSSPEEAYAASRRTHPAMKFRPLSQGSRQSKIRAYDKAASLQPPRDRPPTDASVAKRMVNRALRQPTCDLEKTVKD